MATLGGGTRWCRLWGPKCDHRFSQYLQTVFGRYNHGGCMCPNKIFHKWTGKHLGNFTKTDFTFTARRLAERGICRRRVSVCLSVCVCVSVTLRYCIKTAKRRITQITPHDSNVTLVFWHQSSRRNSNGITPYGGDKCRWGGLKLVTFDEKRTITRKRYKIDI